MLSQRNLAKVDLREASRGAKATSTVSRLL